MVVLRCIQASLLHKWQAHAVLLSAAAECDQPAAAMSAFAFMSFRAAEGLYRIAVIEEGPGNEATGVNDGRCIACKVALRLTGIQIDACAHLPTQLCIVSAAYIPAPR